MSFQSCIVYETIYDFYYFLHHFSIKKIKVQIKLLFGELGGIAVGTLGSVKFYFQEYWDVKNGWGPR